jgi:hypothetical protein
MPEDLLEQLAAAPVPPLPEQFESGVHERINERLSAGQCLDFAFNALPYAVVHFTKAVVGLIEFTVTGQFRSGRKDGP